MEMADGNGSTDRAFLTQALSAYPALYWGGGN